jgi:hypothetical protein
MERVADALTATPAVDYLACIYPLLPGSALTPVLSTVALLSPGAACLGCCTVAGWASALVCALLDQHTAARGSTHPHSGSPVLLVIEVSDWPPRRVLGIWIRLRERKLQVPHSSFPRAEPGALKVISDRRQLAYQFIRNWDASTGMMSPPSCTEHGAARIWASHHTTGLRCLPRAHQPAANAAGTARMTPRRTSRSATWLIVVPPCRTWCSAAPCHLPAVAPPILRRPSGRPHVGTPRRTRRPKCDHRLRQVLLALGNCHATERASRDHRPRPPCQHEYPRQQ